MTEPEIIREKTYKYTTEIGQTAKKEWYIKSIKAKDDNVVDLFTNLTEIIKKINEEVNKL